MSALPLPAALPAALTRRLDQEGSGLTILVVRLAAMGDLLRTLPAVRLLHRHLPAARLFWVLDDRWVDVVGGHPDLAGAIPWPRRALSDHARSPAGWLGLPKLTGKLRRQLRSLDAGLALDFHGNLRSGVTTALSGAPVRLGYAGHQQKEGNHFLTTHRVPSGVRRTPRMERNLDLIRALGLPVDPLPPVELPQVDDGRAAAQTIRRDLGLSRFAVMAPGASLAQAYKAPPARLLAAAARAADQAQLRSLVVWGPGEESLAKQVVTACDGHAILAPATSLAQLAALLSMARLFVGGDSGPMHMACATGCPVVGLYGPTDPVVNQPWGVPYRTVFPADAVYQGIKSRDRSIPFDGISDDQVVQAVGELLTD